MSPVFLLFYTEFATATFPAAISPVFLRRIGIKINSVAFVGSIAMSTYNSLRSILSLVLFVSSQTTR